MPRQDQTQFFTAGAYESSPAECADQQPCVRSWSVFASIALHGVLLFLILFCGSVETVGVTGAEWSALSVFEVGLMSPPGGSGQRIAPQAKKVFSNSIPKQKQQPESAVASENATASQVERLKKNEQQATWEQPEQTQGPQQGTVASGAYREGGSHQNITGEMAGQSAGEGGLVALASYGAVADGGRPFGFSLGEVSNKPKVVKSVPVVYPVEARKKGITGQVLVRFHLDEKGTVSHLHIKSAEPPNIFDQNTLAALRQWRFQPAILNRKAVSVWVELPLEFNLR